MAPIPRKHTRKRDSMSVYLPVELITWLKRLAKKMDISLSDLVTEILDTVKKEVEGDSPDKGS